MQYTTITLLLLCLLVNTTYAEGDPDAYILVTDNDPSFDNSRRFIDKYSSKMTVIEKREFEIAVIQCHKENDARACLLGYFQRLVVKYRIQAVVVAIAAQVLMMILTAFKIDLVGSIPAEGVVVGITLTSIIAPFSTMRIDKLAHQGLVLLNESPRRRLNIRSS